MRLQQRPQLILQEIWSWDGPSESQEWWGVQDVNLLVSYPPTVLWILTETWDFWARVTHSEHHEHPVYLCQFPLPPNPTGTMQWEKMNGCTHSRLFYRRETFNFRKSNLLYVNTYAYNCYWSSFSWFLVKLTFFPKKHPKSIFHYQFIMCTHTSAVIASTWKMFIKEKRL